MAHSAEAFLPTAIQRASVVNLLELLDYQPRSAVPASVDIVVNAARAVPPGRAHPHRYRARYRRSR